jgi:DNA-binding SARP family transcriptional activator
MRDATRSDDEDRRTAMPVDVRTPPAARADPDPVLDLDAPAPTAQVRVLGGFEVRVADEFVSLPSNVERILALLAVRARPQTRISVASTLWMDTSEERAAANLRTALWKARQQIGDCVEVRGNHLNLALWVEIDLGDVVGRARRLLDDGAELRSTDCDPAELVGDLLPEWDEDWILFERERLRQLRIHALECLCRKLSDAGRPGPAIDAGLAAVAAEPLRESAQRVLIAAHLHEGNVIEARRQYHTYRELLWDSLGIEPSEQLRGLVATGDTRR